MQYRVSKYNPFYRNEKGKYSIQEWTSISDIGKSYNGIRFTLSEYLYTEEKYALFYLDLLMRLKIHEVKVSNLDKQNTLSEAIQILNGYDIILDNTERNIYQNLENNQIISIENFKIIFQFAMREIIWCKITAPFPKISIEFGYDYYTYLIGLELEKTLIKKYESQGLFIEQIRK